MKSIIASEDRSLLEVAGVGKSFGGLRVLDDVSFTVETGSITALVGPNGAGKSTLFDIVCGTLRPDQGRLLYQGRNITRLAPHRIARLGLARAFQMTRVFRRMTLWENLRVASKGVGWQQRAGELLELTGLAPLAKEYAEELSYGQQRLLELVRVMMLDPRLVLLDEPAAGVNPTMRGRIFTVIQTLRQQGVTFVVVEHDTTIVAQHCDKVIGLCYGMKVAEGTPEEVQRNEEMLAAYFGS